MESTLIKRHGRILLLAALAAVAALVLFAQVSAGVSRVATAQAAVHHTAHVANAGDPGGNSQAGGPDTRGGGETTADTETGAGEQSLPGGGANDNSACDGNCVQ
jgi:hypothetical protein